MYIGLLINVKYTYGTGGADSGGAGGGMFRTEYLRAHW